MSQENPELITFAEFELDARHRQLFRSGVPVPLNAKAFDLLLFLTKNSGRLISKEEIMNAVWNDQFVEDSNLTVQISSLRTALGERAANARVLLTIPGKGYQFVADVEYRDASVGETSESGQDLAFVAPESSAPNNSTSISNKRRTRPALILALSGTAIMIVAAIVIGWDYFAAPRPVTSIAVLPFVDKNPDPAFEYIGDGLAESVIFSLSKIPDLKVMSSASAFQYRDLSVDAQKIGRELGVASILTGHVTRTGESIVVNAELVSTVDRRVLWGDQFTKKNDDLENLQIDIVRSLTRRLQIKLTGSDERLLEKNQTKSNEAFQLYLAGRFHLNRLTDDGFHKGRDNFQAAIVIDPSYALAHAGLAESYNFLSGWGAVSPHEGFPRAKAAAIRALEIDQSLAEGHTQLGIARLFYDLDWKGAQDEFKKAIKMNPSYSDAYHMNSYAMIAEGKLDEAMESALRSREMDPLSIMKLITVGNIFVFERRTDEAIIQYQKALEMDSNSGLARWSLGNAYLSKRRLSEAIDEFNKAILLSGDSPDEPAGLAIAYALAGNRTEAKKIRDNLIERSRSSYVSPALIAAIHGALGDNDKAFELFGSAVRERDSNLIFLGVDPYYFEPLRSDPRFAELKGRLGLQ